jgi:hypothetical protein
MLAMAVLLGTLLAGCGGGGSGSGDSGAVQRDELAALAPAELTLKDLAAMRLPALPDTTDKKSRVRAMYHWVLALAAVQAGEWREALAELGVARSLYEGVAQQQEDWHARFRNLEAACTYMLDPPGTVQKKFTALESPRADSVLDVQYEWLLGLDALRTGDREAALRHLTLVAGTQFPAATEAQGLLDRLEGPTEPEGTAKEQGTDTEH